MIEGRVAGTAERAAAGRAPAMASADAAGAPRARRGAARPVPDRVEALSHLGLQELRDYRAELGREESRVSYWRRLVQARIDVLAAADDSGLHDLGKLRAVLTDQRAASQRTAVLEVGPGDDRPPLPQLDALWAAADPLDEDARGELLLRLAAAEHELSTYRTALHRRLDAATSELIARYHEDPGSCLVALPE